MDTFDKTVQKAKEVFNTACQKTGEVVNIQKLKIDLASLQNKLTKAYAQLGKIEYKKIKDSTPEDLAVKVALNEINFVMEEISKLKDKIDTLQGKKTCSVCGARVAEDAAFCSKCGANLENESNEASDK